MSVEVGGGGRGGKVTGRARKRAAKGLGRGGGGGMTGEGRRSAAAARTRTPIISPPARPRSRTWQASRGQLHSTTTSQLATGDWRPWPVRWRTTARADGGGGDACARPSDPASHADGLTGAFPTSAALETDIASERIEPIASTSQLEDEVVLPSSGRTLRNRLIKVRRAPRFQPLDLRQPSRLTPGLSPCGCSCRWRRSSLTTEARWICPRSSASTMPGLKVAGRWSSPVRLSPCHPSVQAARQG